VNVEYGLLINTRKADTTDSLIGMEHSSIALVTGRPDYNLRVTGTSLASSPTLADDSARFVRMTDSSFVDYTSVWSNVGYALRSITYSHTLNLFLAIGDVGQVVKSTTGADGTWSNQTIASGAQFYCVTWAVNKFIATGAGGIIYTSVDGSTWVSRTSGTTANIYSATDLAYGSGFRIVAVGGGAGFGVACYSDDYGVTWTANVFGSVAFIGVASSATLAKWVAVGSSGGVAVTSDGVTWSSSTVGSDLLFSVTWTGSQFVTVGFSGNIHTSTNGTSWTSRTSAMPSGKQMRCVFWTGLDVIAGGEDGYLQISHNHGNTWSLLGGPITTALFYSGGVCIDGAIYLSSVENAGNIISSPAEFLSRVYASSANRTSNTSLLGSKKTKYVDLPDTVTITGKTSFDVSSMTYTSMPIDFDIIGVVPENPPTNPVTGQPQIRWKEGVISKDILGNPAEAFDMTLGGGYSTMSLSGLSLMNNLPGLGRPLFKYLRDNGIDLYRCSISIYPIIDGEFVQWSEQQIEKVIDAEHRLNIEAYDSFLTIHKDVLKTEITQDLFPTAPEETKGKFLPLAIGRIPEAELIRISERDGALVLATIGSRNYKYTRAMVQSGNSLALWTPGATFTANDSRLLGARVAVLLAGTTGEEYYAPTITGNFVTTANTTTVQLSDVFRKKDQTPVNVVVGTTENTWWFKIYSITDFEVVSDDEVSAISGYPMGWIDGQEEFSNLPARAKTLYPDGDYSAIPGPAGVLLNPRNEEVNAPDRIYIDYSEPILAALPLTKPEKATSVGSLTIVETADTFPTVGSPATDLVDRDNSTGYGKSWTGTTGLSSSGVILFNTGSVHNAVEPASIASVNLRFPDGFLLESTEKIVIGCNFDMVISSRNALGTTFEAGMTYSLIDPNGYVLITGTYKRIFRSEDVPANVSGVVYTAPGGRTFSHRGLGGEYLIPEETASAWTLVDCDPDEKISKFLRDKEFASGVTLRINFHLKFDTVIDAGGVAVFPFSYNILEMAAFRSFDAYSGTIYQKVTGAKFGGTWGGRKTSANAVTSIPDTIEYLIRQRDESTLIDTDSFDLCLARRPETFWNIGRQIEEQANTKDLIEQLCRHAFLAVAPGRDKNRRLINLEGYVDADTVVSDIIDGSMGDGQVVGLDRVYTGLEIRYDKNPANSEYRSTVFIRKTDEDEFPSYSELIPGTSSKLWKTYAGGFMDYGTAKVVWDRYHAAFLLIRRENVDKRDCDWFQSNNRVEMNELQEDSAVYLALVLSEWYCTPRKRYTFRVPVTAENVARRLGDRVIFMDTKRTGGLYFRAIVEEQTLDTANDQIEIKVSHLLTDEGYAEAPVTAYITEVIGGNTITETIGGNTITEVVN
jgi:hypothetical protein